MALTDAEKTELKNDILNAIKAESQGVDELTEVTSLDNIKSLPALRGTELVSAPLTLLGKPATDAAATANAAATKANNAATNASEAASTAGSAAATANEKAGVAQAAAEAANEAATKAKDAADAVEGSLVGSMTAVPDEENDTVELTLLGKTGEKIASVAIPGGHGQRGQHVQRDGGSPAAKRLLHPGYGHRGGGREIPLQGPLHHLRGVAGEVGDEAVHGHEPDGVGEHGRLGGLRRRGHGEEPDGER